MFSASDTMFTGSQTLSAEKLLRSTHAWRNSEQLKEENEEKAAYLTLRFVYNWVTMEFLKKMDS